MTDAHDNVTRFAYDVGEEIVMRLDGTEVFDVDDSVCLPRSEAPAWTIGIIIERRQHGSVPAYVVRFDDAGSHRLSVVPESAIEGTA